eukprot:m.8676 g.8676  ORF g.8676 m.8676 type:complete len:109 (+) comp5383_c0_seq1:85-411(+)
MLALCSWCARDPFVVGSIVVGTVQVALIDMGTVQVAFIDMRLVLILSVLPIFYWYRWQEQADDDGDDTPYSCYNCPRTTAWDSSFWTVDQVLHGITGNISTTITIPSF